MNIYENLIHWRDLDFWICFWKGLGKDKVFLNVWGRKLGCLCRVIITPNDHADPAHLGHTAQTTPWD